MPPAFRTRILQRSIGRVPGLRRLPIFKLLALGEIALMARDHFGRLDPQERRRLVELVRKGRGRRRDLDPTEREDLARIVAKVEPRAFAGAALDRLSPVPLPKRFTRGSSRR